MVALHVVQPVEMPRTSTGVSQPVFQDAFGKNFRRCLEGDHAAGSMWLRARVLVPDPVIERIANISHETGKVRRTNLRDGSVPSGALRVLCTFTEYSKSLFRAVRFCGWLEQIL